MKLAPYALAAALLLSGCARSSMDSAPEPSQAPPAAAAAAAPAGGNVEAALPGDWDYTVDAMGETISGVITIRRENQRLGGAITSSVFPDLPISSVDVEGNRVTIMAPTPQGDVVLQGTVSSGTLSGQWFLGGDSGPFRATKR